MKAVVPLANESKALSFTVFIAALCCLYVSSRYNYLLFHSLAEIYSVVITFSVFTLAWNSRAYSDDAYLLIVGISCLFIGFLDVLHTLSYSGMAVFTDYDYYATQLWLAARGMESLILLAAFAYVGKKNKPDPATLIVVFTSITALLVVSIFGWKVFPVCFIDGTGLTSFKIYSEYLICAVLGGALFLLHRERAHFERSIYALIGLSIIATIISEVAFTFYVSMYGLSNLVGHYFKIFAFMLIYHAVIKKSFNDPFAMMFRQLHKANASLQEEVAARMAADAQKEKLIGELKTALEEVKTLKGIIPICSYCKKIRNDSGCWDRLEHYISSHSDASFSHGICPSCMGRHFPDCVPEQ